MRALIFSTIFYKTFLILKRIKLAIIINVQSLRVNCLLFLSDFNETWYIVGAKTYRNH
jgi:hypothetical protein